MRRVAAALVLLIACGGSSEGEQVATTTTSPTLAVVVQIRTEDGLVGSNIDNQTCKFHDVSFVVRDAEGKIVATGEGTEAGQVTRTRPNYLCTGAFRAELPRSDFYEVELEGRQFTLGRPQDRWSASATFSQEEITLKPDIYVP